MFEIKLTAEEKNNLNIFLGRVDLKGSEALALAVLLSKINQAEQKKDGE